MTKLLPVLTLTALVALTGCAKAPTAVAAPRQAQSAQAAKAKAPTGLKARVAEVKQVSVTQAAALLQANPQIVLLDVRSPEEFVGGRAKGAINKPLGEIDTWLPTLDKSRRYAVICHSGRRSQIAAGTMVDQGFSDVTNIQGGTAAWADAGLPMDK